MDILEGWFFFLLEKETESQTSVSPQWCKEIQGRVEVKSRVSQDVFRIMSRLAYNKLFDPIYWSASQLTP